jgi:soluble lytic murein transglycosylase-like protein
MNTRPAVALLLCLPLLAAQPAFAAAPNAAAAKWREQAMALEHGSGVARDLKAAVALYCKAAVAGDRQAQYLLGWMYTNGRGMQRNDVHAAYLFRLAADQGDEPSRNLLGTLGPENTKPPCVVEAEVATAEQVQRAAEAALNAAEGEAEENRYRALIDNAERRKVFAIVQRLAPEYGIHPGLAVALIRAESNFNPQAVSGKNAQGLMQLIPATAARFRVTKPFDPEQNIRGGMAYLRWLLAYFQGDVNLTLAAYNAGEGAVERYRGIPPYPETQGYVKRIREVFHSATHPFDQRITPPSPEFPRLLSQRP